MLNLVDNLLDIGKFENDRMDLAPVEVSLRQMVRNAIQHLYIQAGSRQITILTDPECDFIVWSDEGITERILVNLLDNAIKHSPASGTVEVSAESGNSMVRIKVSDNGEGIPAGFMPSVFEKYATARQESAHRSYGLGLTFCRMAVEALGGEIGIDSDPGKGTTVWFTLPLVLDNTRMNPLVSSSETFQQDEALPNLGAQERAFLQESCDDLRELTIHQISDIKDILNRLDASALPGVVLWRTAVARAMNNCDSTRYQMLINMICPSHE
jgi:hypothetical protein